MGPIYTWSDFVDMVSRRRGLIFGVFFLGCVVSYLWALNQQHLYVSSEVIQIEQPRIADDLARSTVQGSSARRLQLIEQQIMARDSLQEVIDKYGLYQDLVSLKPSGKIDLLRRSVRIDGVAAVREGFTDDGTIAILTISAEMISPELARAVAHEFADRTRALSAEQRKVQTAETLKFFTQKQESLQREVAALEDKIAAFRKENDLTIEGGVDFRLAQISSLNEDILELDGEIIAAELARTQLDRNERPAVFARRIGEIEARLETLTQQRELLVARRDSIRDTIRSSPEVERELADFNRRLGQLRGQLDLVTARRNEAEVGFSLESASRGERMVTLEEARLPDYPITASKKRRAMMGAGASLGVALFLAFLLELRRPVIRTASQMTRETGVTPVVSIPVMEEPRGWRARRAARRARGRAGRAARLARQS